MLIGTDFVMEPLVLPTLSKYFQAGGSASNVVDLLSDNYVAVAQVR
jgi:hypothetical protein